MPHNKGWIGVDLDGTLAKYEGWKGPEHIGDPVPAMVDRVRRWLDAGYEVRIFTARVAGERGIPGQETIMPAETTRLIEEWCAENIGTKLKVTCIKDFGMIELWDDRAVQVIPNTGQPVGKSTRGLT